MPFTPIVYRSTPQRPWTIAEAEQLIRTAAPVVPPRSLGPKQLGQLGDRGLRRPVVTQLLCVMPGGLHAVHRLNEQGVPAPFTRVADPRTFAKRQFLAFVFSHLFNLNLVPVSYPRELTNLGMGSLVAIPVADPFLQIDLLSEDRRTVARRPPHRRRGAMGAAVVFAGLIGAGQRFEETVCTGDGTVLIMDAHEAFVYDRDTLARLAAALRADPIVEASFAQGLFPAGVQEGIADMRREKALGMLRLDLGQEPCDRFVEILRELRPPKPSFQGIPFTYA